MDNLRRNNTARFNHSRGELEIHLAAKAFKGKAIRTVTIGKYVTSIKAGAFSSSKATKIVLKTKNLKKSGVKGCFKGSKIKTVQVKVGSKKTNKKCVKAYKKFFTKSVTKTRAKKLVLK